MFCIQVWIIPRLRCERDSNQNAPSRHYFDVCSLPWLQLYCVPRQTRMGHFHTATVARCMWVVKKKGLDPYFNLNMEFVRWLVVVVTLHANTDKIKQQAINQSTKLISQPTKYKQITHKRIKKGTFQMILVKCKQTCEHKYLACRGQKKIKKYKKFLWFDCNSTLLFIRHLMLRTIRQHHKKEMENKSLYQRGR